jgi:putative glutamine amidotransferase
MRPRIGIPPSLDVPEGGGRRLHRIDAAYADAVAEAGGLPIYLPGAAGADTGVASIDALLLPGGPDFVPESPPPGVRFAPVAPEQLAADRALLAAARAAALPVLGVCYGMQLIALESGGRLHYHVPLDVPGALDHKPASRAATHAIALEPGTRLAHLFGVRELLVNTRHHQAVADPGPRLRVAARAADGVIEAVEGAEGGAGPFLMGVQWHPETLAADHRQILYGALVEAASRAKSG